MIDRHRETVNPSLELLPRSSGQLSISTKSLLSFDQIQRRALKKIIKKGLESMIETNPLFSGGITPSLFPLNRGRRLTADIVTNTVDTAYFIDDTIGNLTQ